MPYRYRIVRMRADLRGLDEASVHAVKKRLELLEEEEAGFEFITSSLSELALQNRRLEIDVHVIGEDGNHLLFEAREGRLSEREGSEHELSDQWVILEPEALGQLSRRLEEVRKLAKKRSRAPVDRLLELLAGDAQGPSQLAMEVRSAVYSALSWVESPQAQRVLVDALEREPDAVAESIGYVLWRSDALMGSLPGRIEEALVSGRDTLADRLLAALVRGDDDGRYRQYVLEHHQARLHRLGLTLE